MVGPRELHYPPSVPPTHQHLSATPGRQTWPDEVSEPESPRTTVFLSYSRADTSTLQRIAVALDEAGYLTSYDNAPDRPQAPDLGISAQDEWWQRLQDLIVDADVMVLLVSAASAASRVVDEEVAFARSHGKRVIPVLCAPIDFSTAPPRLAALNVKISVVSATAEMFTLAMAQLCEAIEQDIVWLRTGRVIDQKAREWRAADQDHAWLLHGAEIAEAERWSARRPATAPGVSENILQFLAESRAAEESSQSRQRAQLARQRRQQAWIGRLLLLALVITMAGAAFVANRQRQLSRSESVMLARVAEESFTRGDYIRAIRLSALGLDRGLLRPGSVEAEDVFRRAAQSPILEREFGTSASVVQSWVSDDGMVAALVDGGGSGLSFWDVQQGIQIAGDARDSAMTGVGFALRGDGKRLLSWGVNLKTEADGDERSRAATLWSLENGGVPAPLQRHGHDVSGGLFLPGGGSLVTWGDDQLTLWPSAFDRPVARQPLSEPLEAVRALDDGSTIVLGFESGRIEVRSLRPDRPLALLAKREIGSPISDVALAAAEGLLLVVTEANELVGLVLDTLAVRYRNVPHAAFTGPLQLASVRLGSDGSEERIVANLPPGGGARLIRVATGEALGPSFDHPQVRCARVDDRGDRMLTCGFDNLAHLWDLVSGARLATISHDDVLGVSVGGKVGPAAGMRGAAFLPGGQAVVVWNEDGTIRVHAASTGAQIGGHMRHGSPVHNVLQLPQRRLLTVSDGPVRLWRLPEYAAPVTLGNALCTSEWLGRQVVQLTRAEVGGAALAVAKRDGARVALTSPWLIDDEDTTVAPILRGRAGDSLCGFTSTTPSSRRAVTK